MTDVTIAPRFCGPPDSGNGGYVCGLLAAAIGEGAVTVRLHRPPPLNEPLNFERHADQLVLGRHGDVIASARAALNFDLEVPDSPTLPEAQEAEERYSGHHFHRFPSCFVCGPRRPDDDGLAIYPGRIGESQVAAEWVPKPDLSDERGIVRREFLWAAMDCPGYWAVEGAAGLALLGEMTGRIDDDAVSAGEPLIVSGWGISSEGRKHVVGTALHRPGGRLVACARATWITIAG